MGRSEKMDTSTVSNAPKKLNDAERCRQEIEAAESVVRDRCGFGEYLWLQDWREELRLIEASSSGKSLIAA